MSKELETMLSQVRAAPDHSSFPIVVEALRRQGRVQEALEVCGAGLELRPDCLEGRAALAVLLIELGDLEAAGRELSDALALRDDAHLLEGLVTEADGFQDDVASEELEAAFEAAESDPAEMISANDIAERALEQAVGRDPLEFDGFRAPERPSYATATMAALLEEQGDREGAEAIRAALEHGTPSAETAEAGSGVAEFLDAAEVPPSAQSAVAPIPAAPHDSERILATLESWLENVRSARGRA